MNEILKMLNALSADELDSVIMRASIMLEKKRKEEAEAALREQERQRQEKIEQERRRLEEIAELQRKLQELQSQKVVIPEEPGKAQGEGFVMYDAPKPIDNARTTAAPEPPKAPQSIACPSCRALNGINSQFCASCGHRLTEPKAEPKPAQISCPHCHQLNSVDSAFCAGCGQKIVREQPAPPPPQMTMVPNPIPQTAAAQVRYADESMKKWEMLPGEEVVRASHEIFLLKPDSGKYAYYMEVTNKRILLKREGSGAKNVALVARMGGGLVGSLIAEGVKAAAGAGPKPWLEIPLAAVSSCGVQNKKEFFIVADQNYVLKNKNYESFLPDLVEKAKK